MCRATTIKSCACNYKCVQSHGRNNESELGESKKKKKSGSIMHPNTPYFPSHI